MFNPEEIIFAPTARCNLSCAHCRVSRIPEELEASDAIAFMKDCVSRGVDRLGFSGGEPFLRPDFLCAVSAAAVKLDMYFDRLMTNGVWWKDEAELDTTLAGLYDAGYDGIFGLSVDAYHGSDTARLATFLKAVFRIWGRMDCAEISSVAPAGDEGLIRILEDLAAALDGELLLEEDEPVAIVNSRYQNRDDSGEDDREALYVRIIRVPHSAAAAEDAWKDSEWFAEDYCAGPGNVFYVHPDGKIAVCCGFANENEGLILGKLGDSCDKLMDSAAGSPFVRARYLTGLSTLRKRLAASGTVFPGKTKDLCFFCDYLCAKGLG